MTVDSSGDIVSGVHWVTPPGQLYEETHLAFPVEGPEVVEFPDYTVDLFTVSDYEERPESLQSWDNVEPLVRIDGRTLHELVKLTEDFQW